MNTLKRITEKIIVVFGFLCLFLAALLFWGSLCYPAYPQTVVVKNGVKAQVPDLPLTNTKIVGTLPGMTLNVQSDGTIGGTPTPFDFTPQSVVALGDSIFAGVWSSSMVPMLANAHGIPTANVTNRAISGLMACDVFTQEVGPYAADNPSTSAIQPLRLFQISTNEALFKTSAYVPVFNSCWLAVTSWEAIAPQNKVAGSNATATGSCTSDSTYPAVTGEVCTALGDTLTFNVSTTGYPIILWPKITDNDSGTYSVIIDGTTIGTQTTAQTVPIITGAGNTSTMGFLALNVAAGPHSVTLKKTSPSGTMEIYAIGTSQSGSIVSPGLVIVGDTPREYNGANNTNVSLYASAVDSDQAFLYSLGLPVYLAPVNKRVIATTSAGDMAQTVTIGSQTPGSGYSGTGTCAFVGGTYTTQATCSVAVSGGGLIFTLTANGVYSVPPTAITFSGFTGGSGASATPYFSGQVHPGTSGTIEMLAAYESALRLHVSTTPFFFSQPSVASADASPGATSNAYSASPSTINPGFNIVTYPGFSAGSTLTENWYTFYEPDNTYGYEFCRYTAGTPLTNASQLKGCVNLYNGGVNGVTMTGFATTSVIAGTALTASCDTGTVTVSGAIVGHYVGVSSTTGADVGAAFNVRGAVTSAGLVTVSVCGTGTPPSLAYNVTVF